MFNPLNLNNKLVLVTGASSGIGRATALVLARLGAAVVLCGRRESELRETAALMEQSGSAYLEPFDLAQTDAIPGWMQQICSKHGSGLAGIVHCAGLGLSLPLRVMNRKKMDEVMTVNVYAALALLRGMATKGISDGSGGSVVLISSISGLVGGPGKTLYGASKAALNVIARSAALELASKRIRINCIAPAWVDTPMLRNAQRDLPEGIPDLGRQVLGVIAPEEVGTAAAYLLCDAAQHITGTTLVLDGGYTC